MQEIVIESYRERCPIDCGGTDYERAARRGKFMHARSDIDEITRRAANHDARCQVAAIIAPAGPLTVIVATLA